MEYADNKLIVDELILDPGLPNHIVVRIGAEFHMLRNDHGLDNQVKASDLRPYKKRPSRDWYRPTAAHHFWVNGLVPRGGYIINIGRPATESEFAQIVADYKLTEDDISGVFTDTKGMLYGQQYAQSFPARQIRLPSPGVALELESKLQKLGIEAGSGSPGRLNIRVDLPKH